MPILFDVVLHNVVVVRLADLIRIDHRRHWLIRSKLSFEDLLLENSRELNLDCVAERVTFINLHIANNLKLFALVLEVEFQLHLIPKQKRRHLMIEIRCEDQLVFLGLHAAHLLHILYGRLDLT
jgi:hypothetical protein